MNLRKLKLVWRLRKFLTRVVKLMVQHHQADLEFFILAYLEADSSSRAKATRKIGEDLLESLLEAAKTAS